jgi:S1-C subfamily serine protease
VGIVAAPSYAEISEEQRVHVAQRLKEATVTVFAGQSSGSGFVATAHGWIITNAHVASDARWSGRLRVRFGNGVTVPATLIAYDAEHDLAVAQAQGEARIRPLPLGDSDDVKVGQNVLAFGSPFGLEGTLTQGIVSARRDLAAIGSGDLHGVIQTDAPINPGNSGGPLVNARGEVIGVNTAILSRTGGSNGIGFAVPVKYVKELVGAMERQLGATAGQRDPARLQPPQPQKPVAGRSSTAVWLGLLGGDFRGQGYRGVRVEKVLQGSPAARAGLLSASDPAPPFIDPLGIPWTGHIILALDSHPVRSMKDRQKVLASHQPGEQAIVTVTIGPGIVTRETVVELEPRPAR